MPDDKYNDLLLEELRGIKADLLSIRQDLSNMPKDYIHKSTFWSVVVILFSLISGAYGFTVMLIK